MMAQLQMEGKVRHIGVSNFDAEQIKRCQTIAPVTSLQPPYSLIKRDYEKETLPYCKKENVGVIVYSPMGSGMLTGSMTRERIKNMPPNDWRTKHQWFQEPELTKNLELAEKLKSIGKKYSHLAGEVAIAWTLKNPAVTGAIVGGRSAEQVDGMYRAAELKLDKEDLREMETF
jgi:aryl-alcohol dehydrogenase-like predicted oxidoreductase